MNYGEHARQARVALGLSKSELGRRSGVHHDCICRLELNQRLPELERLLALCKVLNMTPEMYLSGKARPKWFRYREPDFRESAAFHRRHEGLNRQELSEVSGVTSSTISALEYGTRRTYTQTAILLADALRLGLDEYLGFE